MRVAVIGLGEISKLHIAALKECGEEIAAVCDIEAARCDRAEKTFGLAGAAKYTDYIKMLENERLDSVHICTPHYLHAEMICAALRRGVNVLCEKPLAISKAQLEEIGAAVKVSKAKLGVCHQNRYREAFLYLKEFFAKREITSAAATLVWDRDKEYYASGAWRGTKAMEGGGVMINQAIHSLDVLQWFCGYPESVIATTHNHSLKGVIEVEDTAYGLFALKNGGNFVVSATNAAKYCFPIHTMFHSGEDTVEVSADNIIINGKFLVKSDGRPYFGKEEWGVGHYNLIKDYYECLKSGRKFPIDFAEASKAIRLILAMYRSNGEKIDL